MESPRMVDVLAARWYVVALTVAVAMVAGWLVFRQLTPTYTAETLLRLHPVTVNGGDPGYQLDLADRLMSSYATLVESDWMDRELSSVTGADRGFRVRAEVPANTDLLRVSVRHAVPSTAAQMANAAGRHLTDLSRSPFGIPSGALDAAPQPLPTAPRAPLVLSVFEPAVRPSKPSSFGLPETLTLAAMLGLVGGTGLAFLGVRLAP